jgi:hypothetical protein
MSPTFLLSFALVMFVCACQNKSEKNNSMDSLKTEIADEINAFIKSGFFDKEETFENIQDMFYNETLDESWIKQEIDKQYEQRLAEQKTWQPVTDFDRLAAVFDKLNSSGIIALHNAGYTRQDGESDTGEIHAELEKEGIETRGYCFYHTQDMDRAIDGGNLLLAFGDFMENDKLGTDIGKEIVAALQEKGFKTQWNGSIENRIEVVGLKWQKRFGNDNCSNERAIERLSHR